MRVLVTQRGRSRLGVTLSNALAAITTIRVDTVKVESLPLLGIQMPRAADPAERFEVARGFEDEPQGKLNRGINKALKYAQNLWLVIKQGFT